MYIDLLYLNPSAQIGSSSNTSALLCILLNITAIFRVRIDCFRHLSYLHTRKFSVPIIKKTRFQDIAFSAAHGRAANNLLALKSPGRQVNTPDSTTVVSIVSRFHRSDYRQFPYSHQCHFRRQYTRYMPPPLWNDPGYRPLVVTVVVLLA
jgi:hypothetical protein